jgi:putative Ca2+/H+ antiporter (TMEM165/GDT1 family)
MDLTPLVSTFVIIAVAELGDKTQLAAMTLSMSYRAASVFAGAILAVVLVDGISILAGTALAELIPMQLIGLIGVAVFIGFGIYTLLSREAEMVKVRRGKSAILTSFIAVLVMEPGDKTQLSIITLAAKYAAPISVFLGMVFAYVLGVGIAVVVGNRLLRLLPPRYLRIFTGALFIFFGMIFLLSVMGINIL